MARSSAQQLWKKAKQWTKENTRVFLTSGSVGAVLIALRFLSLLQGFELAALDVLLNTRPKEPIDDRIRIITITQKDINRYQWPLEDAFLAELLEKIDVQNPAVVGLDIVRDRPIGAGQEALENKIRSMPNFVGIEVLHSTPDLRTPALDVMWKEDETGAMKKGVGFNNFSLDSDGAVRRNSLYWGLEDETRRSFGLQLAWHYLETTQNIKAAAYPDDQPKYLRFGPAIFFNLVDSHSLYGFLPEGENYQIVANMRDPSSFKSASLSEVMDGQVPDDFFEGRIVLIGTIAENTKDLFITPFRETTQGKGRIGGVEIHANFTSEILSTTLDGRPLLKFQPFWKDCMWIFAWSTVGSVVIWRWRSPIRGGAVLSLCIIGILGTSYTLFFTTGLVFPVVPCLLSLISSAFVVTSYFAHQEKELSRSKEFFQLIINNIPDPVFVKDTNYKLTVVNEAFCELIGQSEIEVLGKSDYELFTPTEADIFRQQETDVLKTNQAQENEESLTSLDGNTLLLATKRSLHKDGAGNLHLVGVIRDITERKKLEVKLRRTAEELTKTNDELKASAKRLRHQANHDPLTGLPNRKLFHEKLNELLEWGEENKQLVGLLFLDLDGFKPVNDNLGHDIGDVLLKAVAQRVKNCLRISDVVCRLGGDEFTVILPGIKKSLDSTIVAKKIRETVSAPYALQGHNINITVSIGISVYPDHSSSANQLVKLADQAMYEAKRNGRNQYYIAPKAEKAISQTTEGKI